MNFVEAKNILTGKNELNLYRGCMYNCLGCSQGLKYPGMDMEATINAPELLSLELSDKKDRKVITIGGLGDPYNPKEEELQLMRGCLEVIDHFGFGVSIITKSELILRDLDLLKKINKKAKCTVVVPISAGDDELGCRLEPGASKISRRIEVLKRLKEEGIAAFISISPLLPYINDTEINLKKILEIAKDCGCRGIIYYGPGIMLRDGSKKYFYESLGLRYPILQKRYLRELKGKSLLVQNCNIQSFDYIIKDFCLKNDLMSDLDEINYYLTNLDAKNLQLSLF